MPRLLLPEQILYEVSERALTILGNRVQQGEPSEDWEWQGGVSDTGYGHIQIVIPAHRLAYVLEHGPIPEGHVIDHVWDRGCRSRRCCNPGHLEPVTRAENNRRGGARLQYCRKGLHAFTPENIYWTPRGTRQCRACRADRMQEFYARQGGRQAYRSA